MITGVRLLYFIILKLTGERGRRQASMPSCPPPNGGQGTRPIETSFCRIHVLFTCQLVLVAPAPVLQGSSWWKIGGGGHAPTHMRP